MIDNNQKQQLDTLLTSLNGAQLQWLSGYIQGYMQAKTGQTDIEASPTAIAIAALPSLQIYYATETGNSKGVAMQLEKQAKAQGFKSKSQSISRLDPEKLSSANNNQAFIFIISTHGEGDPPDTAKDFFEKMQGSQTDLSALDYTILALGDTAYTHFCKAGLDLDAMLIKRGAKAFLPVKSLDVDFSAYIPDWICESLQSLQTSHSSSSIPAASSSLSTTPPSLGFNRKQAVSGQIAEHILLNDIGSNKQTFHISIEFKDNLPYLPGDAAGIIIPFQDTDGKDIAPRLYSIASSPLVDDKRLDMTVALAKHTLADGNTGYGLGSKYLTDLKVGSDLQFYIHQNHQFRLPDNPDADIIMVGPGTGIAPFRAFLQHRQENGASGRNWLFFGDQQAHCDFLYQAEWQDMLAIDHLSRIDLAFSRDQKQKIYVQDRLWEKSDEIMNWLDSGAYFYICGQKDPMSKDVENIILKIIQTQKNWEEAKAKDYLLDLAEQGRYLKDVY